MKSLLFLTCLSSLALGAPAQQPPSARESTEWCDIWISHANETNLPRVLLIGDSITRGYYPVAENLLAGKAYVSRLTTSAFISDPMLLSEIALVLDSHKFDVIHFNNGMHGWRHTEAEYREAFPIFLATIQVHSRGAKLIWANTTPLKTNTLAAPTEPAQAEGTNVDAQKLVAKADVMPASNERIAARNAIALKFVKLEGIPVDDLHSLVADHPEYYRDNVHFNLDGIAAQGSQVAAEIEKLLAK